MILVKILWTWLKVIINIGEEIISMLVVVFSSVRVPFKDPLIGL